MLDIFKYLEHLMYPGRVASQLCHLWEGRGTLAQLLPSGGGMEGKVGVDSRGWGTSL